RSESVQHGFDRPDLGSGLCDIAVLVVDVTPPVPARVRIVRQVPTGFDLRVEHNEMVGISPRIVTSVIDEPSADVADVLLASMQHDRDAARPAVVAVFGDENIAGVAQA